MFWDPISRRLAADAHTRLSRELSALRRRSRGEGRILRDELAEATRQKSSGGTVGFYGSSDSTTDLGTTVQVYPWDTEIKAAHGVSVSDGRFTFSGTADWILLVNATVFAANTAPTSATLQPRLNGVTFIPPQARVGNIGLSKLSVILVGLVQATSGDYMEIVIQTGANGSEVNNVPEGSSLVLQRV